MCVCVRVCVRDEVEAGPSLFTDHSVTEVLLIGHFEVVLLFSLFLSVFPSLSSFLSLSSSLPPYILCAACCSVQSWMNDLEQAHRAVLPWQRSLAQPVTAGCNSTP